jgi:outer membrane protein
MKKIKIYAIVIAWSLCVLPGYSQERTLSLEDCIHYAVEHNISIQQLKIQKENAEVDLNTAKMNRLPNLNAQLGQNWDVGFTQIRSGLYENRSQSNSNFSITGSIPLFTGFRITNELARQQLELQAAVQNLEKAQENLALNVTSLFLQVLFNKEILKINEIQLALSQSQVERTQVLVTEGKVPASQLYNIEAQVANDQVTLIQTENNLKMALLDLAQSLELEYTDYFDIYAPEMSVEEYTASLQVPAIIFDNALQIKPVIRELELRVESSKKALKVARSGYYPNLNISFGYNTNYFYLYDDMIQNASFSNQLKNNAREYVGLSLSIPIFNRFSTRNQVRNTLFNIKNQQLILENTKKTLYKEIETAYLNAVAAQEQYHASGLAVKATSKSFQYTKELYETGKLSVFEFNEAKMRLIKSRSEKVQAKYDYIFRAKILDFYNGIPIRL